MTNTTITLTAITPPATPARAVLLDHKGLSITTVPLTASGSNYTGTVAERYANGAATYDELNTASAAARIAASATAAWDATKSAQVAELRRVCVCIEQGIDPYPQLQEELK